jgi:hypothetical protein
VELKALSEYFKENICIFYRYFPCAVIHPSEFQAAPIAEANVLLQKFIEVHDTFLNYNHSWNGLGGILRVIEKTNQIHVLLT